MKPEEYEQWKSIREKGKIQYSLFNGVLTYGIAMVVAMAIVNKPYDEGLFTTKMLIHVVTWLTSGLFFGIAMWLINESQFKKHSSAGNDK